MQGFASLLAVYAGTCVLRKLKVIFFFIRIFFFLTRLGLYVILQNKFAYRVIVLRENICLVFKVRKNLLVLSEIELHRLPYRVIQGIVVDGILVKGGLPVNELVVGIEFRVQKYFVKTYTLLP